MAPAVLGAPPPLGGATLKPHNLQKQQRQQQQKSVSRSLAAECHGSQQTMYLLLRLFPVLCLSCSNRSNSAATAAAATD